MRKDFFALLIILATANYFCIHAQYLPEPSFKDPSADISLAGIEEKFRLLNNQTPLDLRYNSEVGKVIDQYLSKRRKDIEIYLQRASYYFPLIEEILDRYDLPFELKYLAVIESGLNPNARSASGAVGLWQFLLPTCNLFNLRVDSYIDERRDIYKSTDAACRYLQYLYRTFNDWNLVMAGFCNGPGEVRKAISRGGSEDYWTIRPYLPEQARNYVPAFNAICYLMHYHKQYGLFPDSRNALEKTDTLMIDYQVYFLQISSVLQISLDEIEQINPVYRRGVIPDLETPCTLVLPEGLILKYILNESRIAGTHIHNAGYSELVLRAGDTENCKMITHVVANGEGLHKIAIRYNCTMENIQAWNSLTSLNVIPGQQLSIWIPLDE